MAGLYIHIPFCRVACSYCDFHFSVNLSKKPALVQAICREIEQQQNYLGTRKLDSVYFGGGTPSVLTLEELRVILDVVAKHFSVEKDAEITFELNPEDAKPEYLAAIRQMGVNRLSIGVQSFNDAELKWMNRVHSSGQSIQCITDARAAGFTNISIDLIYGSRFQTEQSWRKTLQRVFDLGVPHISAYNLTIEGRTKLFNEVQKEQEPEVDSSLSARLFDILMEEAEKAGYLHYEISNFCKPGYMAVHNANYWRGHSYLGVGPAAHSYNGQKRRFNVRSNSQYIQALEQGKKYGEEEELTLKDKYNEYILTRLRTSWGCDIGEITAQFGPEFREHFMRQLEKHRDKIIRTNDSIVLNRAGKHFADGIAADLFY